jgi:SAM-dependent methyltransferase
MNDEAKDPGAGSSFILPGSAMPDYDALVDTYERGMARVTALHARAVVRALRVRPGYRVLDLAAGTGVVAEALVPKVGPGGLVVAADISAMMLRAGRRRLDQRGRSSIDYVQTTAESPGLADRSFDAVSCAFGLMHFVEPAEGLRAMRGLVRPGGRCAVTVWAPLGKRLHSPFDEAFAARFGNDGALFSHRDGFSLPGTLTASLTAAGFLKVDERAAEATLIVKDLDEWWQIITSGRLGMRLKALKPKQAARVRKDAYDRAERFATRDGTRWHFPADAVLAVGVAP